MTAHHYTRLAGNFMSTGEKFFHLTDYLTDRLNPILVKETRQALKSRQFIVTFTLLLTIAWLISVFGAMLYGPAIEYGSPGHGFFSAYCAVIGFAILFIVPFGAFRSMLTERDQNTFELLSISTLSPRQIVTGKLLSSLVQIFIYYSAIAPFIAFTSLLQGFDLPMAVLFLLVGLVWSTFVCMISIMLSTLSDSRQWQAMTTIGMIILLFVQLMFALTISVELFAFSVPLDSAEFWWVLASWLVGAGSYFLLAQQIAVARLTFESGNRSSGIRVIATLQFWLVWAGILTYGWWYRATSIDDDMVFSFAVMSCIHWLIVGLIFSTESDHISRRVRRSLPQSRIIRVLLAPWMPGGRRGFLLLTIHMLALVVIIWLPVWPDLLAEVIPLPHWQEWVGNSVTAMALYAYIYVGLGAAVGRWSQAITPEFRPAHARVLTILIAGTVLILPYLPGTFGFTRGLKDDSLFYVLNPIKTVDSMFDDSTFGAIANPLAHTFLLILSSAAGVVFLINLSALFKGIQELVRYQPEPVRNLTDSDGEQLEAVLP
jgi:hypothetical protein